MDSNQKPDRQNNTNDDIWDLLKKRNGIDSAEEEYV